jgi:putative heme-binding domain-containing protein
MGASPRPFHNDVKNYIVIVRNLVAASCQGCQVETKAGKTLIGILARESVDAVHLLTTERVEIRISRDEIETFVPGRVSIMPPRLDTQLSRRELQDFLAYLQSLG